MNQYTFLKDLTIVILYLKCRAELFFLLIQIFLREWGFLMRVHFYMQKYLKANPIMIKFYQWNYCVDEKVNKHLRKFVITLKNMFIFINNKE